MGRNERQAGRGAKGERRARPPREVTEASIRGSGLRPEQVQDFTSTPGSLSTCIYYTGLDPFTLKEVYVLKGAEERKKQRALLQYWKPENKEYAIKARQKANPAT